MLHCLEHPFKKLTYSILVVFTYYSSNSTHGALPPNELLVLMALELTKK
jgi:hypothetical protein